ncbi:MAG: hypothetical protein ACREOK_10370 [Gemmatimonadaceae bacterium]
MAHDHPIHDWKADARAAFMGLIFGAIALLAIVYAIVQLTNKKFEGHSAAAPAGAVPAATSAPAH